MTWPSDLRHMIVYTIGHGNQSIDSLIRLLAANGIRLVVDARTSPYSRFLPHFNKESLQRDLQGQGLGYLYLGSALGGRPADPTCYRHRTMPREDVDYLHEVDYAEVMTRPQFLEGIRKLLQAAGGCTTAVLCSEEDPAQCHRHHLIAVHLMSRHPEVVVKHIRGDGTVFGAASLLVSVDGPGAEQLRLF